MSCSVVFWRSTSRSISANSSVSRRSFMLPALCLRRAARAPFASAHSCGLPSFGAGEGEVDAPIHELRELVGRRVVQPLRPTDRVGDIVARIVTEEARCHPPL